MTNVSFTLHGSRRARFVLTFAGYTIVELLVATAIMLTMTAAVVGLVRQAQGTFQAQPEVSEIHQRLRVGIDAVTRDLLMAGAGIPPGMVAAVMPYGVGDAGSYRTDTLSVRHVPRGETAIASRTYYLEPNTSQLMIDDGEIGFPLLDHVVKLEFAYFDTGDSPLDPGVLQDGPWVPDPDAMMFDADLLRIRRVRFLLRLEAVLASMRGPSGALFTRGGTSTAMERYVPDHEVRVDVAIRNMNLDR